jgi:hypothetical protein
MGFLTLLFCENRSKHASADPERNSRGPTAILPWGRP